VLYPTGLIYSAVTFPVTSRLVSEPTLVMFGCAAVVRVPVTKLALTKFAPVKLLALALPVTANEVNVPTDVMLGCAAVVTVPAVVAVATAPVTLAPCMLDKLLPLPIKKFAVTALPKLALDAETFPTISTVEPVTVTTFALPAALIVTLALANVLTFAEPF
jgi:hypothetical protein